MLIYMPYHVKTSQLKESDKIFVDHTILSHLSKSTTSLNSQMPWQHGVVYGMLTMVLLIVYKNPYALFRRIKWQLGETLCRSLTAGQFVSVSSQTVVINGPLMKQLCFLRSPDAECATPFADCISLLSSFLIQLPITVCPRLWQSNVGVTRQLGPRPGIRYWLFCMSPGTTVDPLTTSRHTPH